MAIYLRWVALVTGITLVLNLLLALAVAWMGLPWSCALEAGLRTTYLYAGGAPLFACGPFRGARIVSWWMLLKSVPVLTWVSVCVIAIGFFHSAMIREVLRSPEPLSFLGLAMFAITVLAVVLYPAITVAYCWRTAKAYRQMRLDVPK